MRPGRFWRTKLFSAIFRKIDVLTEVIEVHSSRFCGFSRQLRFQVRRPGPFFSGGNLRSLCRHLVQPIQVADALLKELPARIRTRKFQ